MKIKMDVQLRANFSGHVQGVGFRFKTESISRKFDVKGYVKNLVDGKVELVAEGKKSEVEAFLAEIQSQLEGNIRETTESWCNPSGNFDRFSIQH